VTYGKRSKTVGTNPSGTIFANAAHYDTNLTNEKTWDLPDTIREDWVQHEPNGLFPDPSSTVPNATMTQQRVLDRVIAPPLLGQEDDVDVPTYKPPEESSVPWSDLCKFTQPEAGEESDPHGPNAAEPVVHPPKLPEQAQRIPSQRSRRGSSVPLRGSPLRTDVIFEGVDPKAVMPPPQATISSQDMGPTPVASKHTQEKVQKSSQRQKNKMSSLPNSEDDLVAFGLPKEQYVPRPSRSRSLKVDIQEPVDFSVRPEKTAKATRRRKTIATASPTAVDNANAPDTPQKLQKLHELGFTSKAAGKALNDNNGDVQRTIEWLVDNDPEEDELAGETPEIISTTKAVTGDMSTNVQPLAEAIATADELAPAESPVKSDAVADPTGPPNANTPMRAAHLKSPKVQVVIPAKSPQKPDQPITASRKAKRRKTTLDEPEPNSTLKLPVLPDAVIEKKKKARGRPKKAALPTDETPILPQKEAEVLQPIEENTILPDNKQEVHAMETSEQTFDTAQDTLPTTTMVPKQPPQPTTSRTPEPSLKRPTPPASTGKAQYRVGLSKRARIAPLLRIMKK